MDFNKIEGLNERDKNILNETEDKITRIIENYLGWANVQESVYNNRICEYKELAKYKHPYHMFQWSTN